MDQQDSQSFSWRASMMDCGGYDPADRKELAFSKRFLTSMHQPHMMYPTPNPSPSPQMNPSLGTRSPVSPWAFKPAQQRFWLHIRQQPRAGRACTNSRDRRPIDPPPIVQLQISDFNPDCPGDMDDIRDHSFIVHCTLRSASCPKTDLSVILVRDEKTGECRAEKQIHGSIDANAFFCSEDPDPASAPAHPSSWLYCPPTQPLTVNGRHRALPATFFCFSDLSIRKAGEYRLEFQLMRVRMDGQPFQILHSVMSDRFNIVNAKDFDHVQPSTPLVAGLVAKGLGFPLKLKKGPRAPHSAMDD